MLKDIKNFIVKSSVFFLLFGLTFSNANEAVDIINDKCTACHSGTLEKGLSRISKQRKSPESWELTINRMQMHNGLSISSKEKEKIIKYLADTQGLAPSESQKYRYILEKRPNFQEPPHDQLFTEMCARCHSAARVGLEKRTEGEWRKLVHFHLGHMPTLEYQALSRDREWFKIALEKMVPFLSKENSFENSAWSEWVKSDIPTDMSGEWTVFGQTLGAGAFSGTLNLKKGEDEHYDITLDGKYIDGRPLKGEGKATIFTKYDYRASLSIEGVNYRQVFSIDPKNRTLKGRMYQTIHPEEGSQIVGASNKTNNLLALYPQSIKAGDKAILRVIGTNLSKKIELPKELKILKIIKQNKNEILLHVKANESAKSKRYDVQVGDLKLKNGITIYNKIDFIKVLPDYAIARVGDGGGLTPKQHAIFEAYGYSAGADNKIGTKDDIPLGRVDARWRIEPFDKEAKANKDVSFVGIIDSYSGRFIPSFAGLNPKRAFRTNNAGNIKVVASLEDEGKIVEANSHLIVTIQKWVNAPIE